MQNTIAILSDKRPEGWVLINEDDFDPAVHKAKINGQQVIIEMPEPELEPEPLETPEIPINEPQVRKPGRPRK